MSRSFFVDRRKEIIEIANILLMHFLCTLTQSLSRKLSTVSLGRYVIKVVKQVVFL